MSNLVREDGAFAEWGVFKLEGDLDLDRQINRKMIAK